MSNVYILWSNVVFDRIYCKGTEHRGRVLTGGCVMEGRREALRREALNRRGDDMVR